MSEKIDAAAIFGFSVKYLAAKYDNTKPIPPFHMEMWELCCSDSVSSPVNDTVQK